MARRCVSTLRHDPNRASKSSAIRSNASAAGARAWACTSGSDGEFDRLGRTMEVNPLLKLLPRTIVEEAALDFPMHDVANVPVKLGIERPLEQHREVASVLPVALPTELGSDPLVEQGAGERVSHRNADLVGAFVADQVARGDQILPAFGRIAELDEPAGADPVRLQQPRRRSRGLTVVPLSMASRIFCEPDSIPSQTSRAPARASAETLIWVIKLTRDCMVNGISASARSTSSAKAQIQSTSSPRISSVNHKWLGPTSRLSRCISS